MHLDLNSLLTIFSKTFVSVVMDDGKVCIFVDASLMYEDLLESLPLAATVMVNKTALQRGIVTVYFHDFFFNFDLI